MSEDKDVPKMTDRDFARGKPFAEAFPEHHRSWRKRGRARLAPPKVNIGFLPAVDVVRGNRATGRGSDARVKTVLPVVLEKREP